MTTIFSKIVASLSSGHRPQKFKNFNELGAHLLRQGTRPVKHLEQKLRMNKAMRRGLVRAAITWGARSAFIDQSESAPLLVATARDGQSFTVAVTGDPQAWLRAAAAMPHAPEADDAGLFRYLSASERVRSGPSHDEHARRSPTVALQHVFERTRLAA